MIPVLENRSTPSLFNVISGTVGTFAMVDDNACSFMNPCHFKKGYPELSFLFIPQISAIPLAVSSIKSQQHFG
jgi:hypothetical protein